MSIGWISWYVKNVAIFSRLLDSLVKDISRAKLYRLLYLTKVYNNFVHISFESLKSKNFADFQVSSKVLKREKYIFFKSLQ